MRAQLEDMKRTFKLTNNVFRVFFRLMTVIYSHFIISFSVYGKLGVCEGQDIPKEIRGIP